MPNHNRFIGLVLVAASLTCAAYAQVDLSVTTSEFGPFNNTTCSQYSPQYANLSTFPSGAIAACVNSITIWVTNKGTAATAGPAGAPVVVVESIVPVSPRDATVLAANGYCGFSGGCSSLGSPAADGWNCAAGQGTLNCSRSDVLQPGQSYPPIVIRALIENYNPGLRSLNSLTSVAGGTGGPSNLVETDASDNTRSEYDISFPSAVALPKVTVTVHSVPEGRVLLVDGSFVTTPRTYIWTAGDFHSIEADAGGVPFPGNVPWTFNNFSTGGVITTVRTNTLFSQFPPNVIPGLAFYEHVTAIFTRNPVGPQPQ